MGQSPLTDNEWAIHSLNIHGNFFQNRIAKVINEYNPKRLVFVTTEYPVEYPPNHSREESRLDVLGFIPSRFKLQSGIYLIIECKKANPDFVDWVFYPTIQNQLFEPECSRVSFVRNLTIAKNQNQDKFFAQLGLTSEMSSGLPIFGDCREVRGSYENVSKGVRTKTSNSSITDAAYQVTLATHSLASDQRNANSKLIEEIGKSTIDQYLYIPIIITTANLCRIDFNLDDVDISSGEIQLDKVGLKPVDMLFYEYPIPPHLQILPDTMYLKPYDLMNDFRVRRNILIVNARCLEKALDWLISSESWLVDSK